MSLLVILNPDVIYNLTRKSVFRMAKLFKKIDFYYIFHRQSMKSKKSFFSHL